jgi:hypothetical protein
MRLASHVCRDKPSLSCAFSERHALPAACRVAMRLLQSLDENNAMALCRQLPSNWHVRSIF